MTGVVVVVRLPVNFIRLLWSILLLLLRSLLLWLWLHGLLSLRLLRLLLLLWE